MDDQFPKIGLELSGKTPAQSDVFKTVMWTGVCVNGSLAVFKLLAGNWGDSQAVVADGIESLLDVFTVIMVYAGSRFWTRPPDHSHPFGHGRMETLMTVFIGVSLIAAAVGIGWKSIATLHDRHFAAPGWIAAAAALTSIIGKEILYRWTAAVGKKIKSAAMAATAWHYRSDSFSSYPVVVAVAGAILFPGWSFLDHVGAVVVSIFILYAAFRITWPGLKELIDAGAPAEIRGQIRETACENKAVIQVHDIRTRYIGSSLQVVLHVVVDGRLSVREGHVIAQDVERRLMRDVPEVVDVVVHVEPPEGAVPDPLAD
jgi:cation diffusion facilitator family transporter